MSAAVDDLLMSAVNAVMCCGVFGTGRVLEWIETDAGDEGRALKRICAQAGALGVVDHGDIVRLIEGRRG